MFDDIITHPMDASDEQLLYMEDYTTQLYGANIKPL